MKSQKLTQKQKMMAKKTTSKVPKTPEEKQMWIQSRRIVAKSTGRYGEDDIPWGLVQKIYKDEKKGGKMIKESDIRKAKISKTVRKYKTP